MYLIIVKRTGEYWSVLERTGVYWSVLERQYQSPFYFLGYLYSNLILYALILLFYLVNNPISMTFSLIMSTAEGRSIICVIGYGILIQLN